jgi:hypothetical protein
MLPAFEFEGWIAIVAITITIIYRMYKCNKNFDYNLNINLICLAIFTSLLWLLFGYHYKIKDLIKQFSIAILLYILILTYFYCNKHF